MHAKLLDPTDCSLPGCSVHEILQARILKWVVIPSSRGSSWSRDQTLIFWSEVARLCPTHCDPMDCSPPGSSVQGIFQARVLEWVVISFSRGSSQPRDRTRVSHIAGRRFTIWATREAERRVISNRWHLNDNILEACFSFMFTLSFNPTFASLLLSRWLSCKEFSCKWRRNRRHEFDPCVRSPLGYSPGGHKESDITELLSTHTQAWCCPLITTERNPADLAVWFGSYDLHSNPHEFKLCKLVWGLKLCPNPLPLFLELWVLLNQPKHESLAHILVMVSALSGISFPFSNPTATSLLRASWNLMLT